MGAIRTTLRRLLADSSGATAIEYGLIAALIVIAMMGGLGGMWTDIGNSAEEHM